MLTNKGKYGLKAMVHLAGMPPGQPALVADIAEANAIPKKFLDAILGELRTAGFVHSKKGRGGGYVLARPATEIMVGAIVRALDGPLAPIGCASRTSSAAATIARRTSRARCAASWRRSARRSPRCSMRARSPKCARSANPQTKR